MHVALVIVISLLTTVLWHSPILNGTWSLDCVRSDFGAVRGPREFIVRLEQEDNRLDIMMLIADAGGRRVIYREVQPPKSATTSLVWTSPEGPEDDWQITGTDELTITRFVIVKSHVIPQRLVLSRTSVLE